jgi:hypothetical protein
MFEFQSHGVQPESVKITFTDYADAPQFTTCKIAWATDADHGGITLYLPYQSRILTDLASPVA